MTTMIPGRMILLSRLVLLDLIAFFGAKGGSDTIW